MNDAHVYEMQVQMWKPNTWGVTQGMVLDAVVDLNILSYPVPIIMRERGVIVRQGGASLWTSGEARSALGGRARRSIALAHRARQS